MSRRALAWIGLAVLAAVAAWVLFVGLPRLYTARKAATAAAAGSAAPQAAGSPVRKITATLFYVSEDGMNLTPAQREVPFAAATADQARAIIEAQLAAAPPLVSAIPADTRLRDVFITERGDAFVDLSGEIASKHSGGSLDEIFTVYTIVDALTVNLPAIKRVQILVDGKEVDTLAGHVDLRHPLAKGVEWMPEATAAQSTR
jgi:spore germination protein GerM